MITILRAAVALSAGLALSETPTVKLAVPDPVGVPEMTPLDGPNVSPMGKLPCVTAQVYGAIPPAALSVALYGMPDFPSGNGNDEVVMVSVGLI